MWGTACPWGPTEKQISSPEPNKSLTCPPRVGASEKNSSNAGGGRCSRKVFWPFHQSLKPQCQGPSFPVRSWTDCLVSLWPSFVIFKVKSHQGCQPVGLWGWLVNSRKPLHPVLGTQSGPLVVSSFLQPIVLTVTVLLEAAATLMSLGPLFPEVTWLLRNSQCLVIFQCHDC